MNILSEIVAKLRPRLEERKRTLHRDTLEALAANAPKRAPFAAAFRTPGLHVIAELKKASPSKGLIREHLTCQL